MGRTMPNEKRRKRIYHEWFEGAAHQSKRGQMDDERHEAHARNVCERHGLKMAELAEVVLEGARRNWS